MTEISQSYIDYIHETISKLGPPNKVFGAIIHVLNEYLDGSEESLKILYTLKRIVDAELRKRTS
jgi:hypothetical protein